MMGWFVRWHAVLVDDPSEAERLHSELNCFYLVQFAQTQSKLVWKYNNKKAALIEEKLVGLKPNVKNHALCTLFFEYIENRL